MNIVELPTETRGRTACGADLCDVVGSIGSERFGASLIAYLYAVCGADHCVAYEFCLDTPPSAFAVCSLDGSALAEERMQAYASRYWRRDPVVSRLHGFGERGWPTLIRTDMEQLPSDFRRALYPEIRDRMILIGGNRHATCLLSIVRSDAMQPLTDGGLERLYDSGGLLASALARHAELMLHRPGLDQAVRTLPLIESIIVTAGVLPRREAQVCARALYGMSTEGAAADLGIGVESVKTYRKRAYQRLDIGSERELLIWYLELWHSIGMDHGPRDRPH
jgi:DNA-binding CsgD family transcriptional regulator